MTADDLSAPLGQAVKKRRKFPGMISRAMPLTFAGGLALFLAVFVAWAIVGDDPLGGEPVAVVPVDLHGPMAPKKAEEPNTPEPATPSLNAAHAEEPGKGPITIAVPPAREAANAAANTKTVTIIDGKTGARQDVVIPQTGNNGTQSASPADKFVELTAHGPIPKIAADGARPAEAYAQPVKALAGKPDAPRIALIVAGLGVSSNVTSEAIAKLPAPVTLAFMPYSFDVDHLAGEARRHGHEVLLQAPMEPFGYPDNDSGPQTLLTSLTPEQNIERLHWLMSRLQGYVGIINGMGARFTSSEQSFAPVLRETAKRGLIFVDDGANPRSLAARITSANNQPFAKADIVLDSVPTPAELDHALGRLEMLAREHGLAVGICAALPVSIEHVAKWAKGAEGRGVQLVPITVVALKEKQS